MVRRLGRIEQIIRRHKIHKKKNVIGWSNELRPRVRAGEVVPKTSVVRVYVVKKEPSEKLELKHIIPQHVLHGKKKYETDVVEIGEIRAIPPDNVTVQATVFDWDTALPVKGANASIPGVGQGTTDANGQYYFPNVPTGTYTLNVTAAGYQDFTESINVSPLSTGFQVNLKKGLTPPPPPSPNPPPNTARIRPVKMGYSFGHFSITAGTAGYTVWVNGVLHIMTNNHVGANQSSKQHQRALRGDPILQPGPYDGGVFTDGVSAGDSVGTNAYWVPLDETGVNKSDAELTRPFTDLFVQTEQIAGLESNFTVGMQGVYVGRSSGTKQVAISDPSATVQVGYQFFTATFTDVIIVTPPAIPGDSGSGVLGTNNKAWGLIFAGSSLVGIICKIGNILADFALQGLSISFVPPAPPPVAKVEITKVWVEDGGTFPPHPPPVSVNHPVPVHVDFKNVSNVDYQGYCSFELKDPSGKGMGAATVPSLAGAGQSREVFIVPVGPNFTPQQPGTWNATGTLLDAKKNPLDSLSATFEVV